LGFRNSTKSFVHWIGKMRSQKVIPNWRSLLSILLL
jgi:hypothetical protein